jgi:hypothetical protein
MRNGKPWLPVMGEIHYSRYPQYMWRDAVLKSEAGGLDIVATYVFWNHHEEVEGQFDWSGQRDLRTFLELCAEQKLHVLVRIGPWCHGEVRNGGFPDWVQRLPHTRTDDPQYLKYVRRWYQEIFSQCEGLLYKDGGPIIAIQLENEFPGPVQHIVTLKELARDIGFDVPLYTETGWGVSVPENEVIPVYGGYADAPWVYGTHQLDPDGQFLFRCEIPVDVGIGTDVLGETTTSAGKDRAANLYPQLTAEVGFGNQVYRTRRPIISRQDAISLQLIKLAGGANLLGNYIYHGATNPVGKLSTLEEPGYPELSYDFQTAISEFGETNEKYLESKLLHYWLQDFGESVAPMLPVMPQQVPVDVRDTDTLRFMARIEGDSGYLFFSNYQRYVEGRDVGPQQVRLLLDEEEILLPTRPVTVPMGFAAIWPVNLSLTDALLKWATAQLVCRVPGRSGDVYFFYANPGIQPEFVFDASTAKRIDARQATVWSQSDLTVVDCHSPGKNCTIDVTTAAGRRVTICVLNRADAMGLFRFQKLWGQPRVVIADGDVLCSGEELELRRIGGPCRELSIYPPPESLHVHGLALKEASAGLFTDYAMDPPNHTEAPAIGVQAVAEHSDKWEISIPSSALDQFYDVYLSIDYVGDRAKIFLDGVLLADHYYFGPAWRPSLRHWGPRVLGKTLTLEIKPLWNDSWCYLESEARPDFSGRESIAEIQSFTVEPQYRLVLTAEATE